MGYTARVKNFMISIIFVSLFFVLLKPFIVRQIVIRGDGYLGFDMNQDAIRQYKKALLLEPENVGASNWLAYAYKRAGNAGMAVETYKDSLRLAPNNIVAYYELGMAYAVEKNFKEAKEYFLKASSMSYDQTVTYSEEYEFYHKSSLRMLDICQKRLGEN